MSQKTISLQLNDSEVSRLKTVLKENGWEQDTVNNEYIALRMKNESGSVCTLYTSKKIVFQGKDDFDNIVNQIKDQRFGIEAHLGVDEVGKGDYFGPLVVVACFVNNDFLKRYGHLDIGDSKKFSDSKIRNVYDELKDYDSYYKSTVYPPEYNELYTKLKNASILLARQHSKVIEMGLKDLNSKDVECKKVVIDQFSSKENRVIDELGPLGSGIEFVQFHKGESDLAVACASIIARGIFLEEMDKMNREYYFNFPKGASNVISSAREFVAKHGTKELEKVAKVSFKTTKKVIQSSF